MIESFIELMDTNGFIWSAAAVCFAFGACMASFINAVVIRTMHGVKWWGRERSVCDICGETLGARDLVPLFSYAVSLGRCRRCGARISPRYPLVELTLGSICAALFVKYGMSCAFLISVVLCCACLFNSLTDFDSGYIYDIWALAPGAFGILVRLTESGDAAIDGAIGAAVGFGAIAVIIIVSRGGMGWGDAMLMAGVGGSVGWRYELISLYAGFMIGGIVMLPLLLMKKVSRKDAVPLGPFLAVGSVIVLLAGDRLLPYAARFIGPNAGWPW